MQIPAIAEAACAHMRTLETIEAREARIVKVLTEVRDGASETTSARPLAELTNGRYSIVVHEESHPFRQVLCGDIPKR